MKYIKRYQIREQKLVSWCVCVCVFVGFKTKGMSVPHEGAMAASVCIFLYV